jgi:putative transcriptional regulator
MLNKLKTARESKSLTQEQLANLVGVSRQSIISIEKGHYVPTTVLALKIAVVLKLSVEDIFNLEKKDWQS